MKNKINITLSVYEGEGDDPTEAFEAYVLESVLADVPAGTEIEISTEGQTNKVFCYGNPGKTEEEILEWLPDLWAAFCDEGWPGVETVEELEF